METEKEVREKYRNITIWDETYQKIKKIQHILEERQKRPVRLTHIVDLALTDLLEKLQKT